MTTAQQRTDLGKALVHCLVSPNEADSNGEPANVVDGLFAIARAIDRLAGVLGQRPEAAAGREEPW